MSTNYIYLGQLVHPIGSYGPPWAAGEYFIIPYIWIFFQHGQTNGEEQVDESLTEMTHDLPIVQQCCILITVGP